MPLNHVTKVFAIKDLKVFPLTADPAGGSATYGTGVDVPGAKTLTISGDINSVELRGDNTSLDRASSLGTVDAAIEFAKLSLDILSAITNATTVDAGTTPNQTSVWTLVGATQLAYVGLTAVAVGADPIAGDVMFSIYKAIPTSFPELGLAEEDYKTNSLEFGCIPLLATGNKWIGAAIRETTAVLAAPA
jgi:hypothetical protein